MLSQSKPKSTGRMFRNQSRTQLNGRQGLSKSKSFSESSLSASQDVKSRKNSESVKNQSLSGELNRTPNTRTQSPNRSLNRGSKFSKINDTMTKCKKFSNLHVKPNQVTNEGTGSSPLEDTFTIDPEVNPLPVSQIPHVDREGDDNVGCNRRLSNAVIDGKQMCLKRMSAEMKCSQNSKNDRDGPCLHVEPALDYSYCVDNLQAGTVEGNDSGASTLIDQSANSIGSLASVSTLIDGQNRSQNLSGMEDKPQLNENSTEITVRAGVINGHRKLSATITTSKPDVLNIEIEGPASEKCVNKVIRAMKFDNANDKENTRTPNKGIIIIISGLYYRLLISKIFLALFWLFSMPVL